MRFVQVKPGKAGFAFLKNGILRIVSSDLSLYLLPDLHSISDRMMFA